MGRLADVSKDTLNKLSPDTGSRVLGETLPRGTKPLQALTMGETVRAISAKLANAGDRSEADAKASALLALAT